MARNNTLSTVFTRPVYNTIKSGALTLSASAYTAGDYLCTNYITYSGAFLEQTDAFTKIVGVRIRETITAGTLQKPALTLYFWDECDIVTTANSAFAIADGTNTTINNLVGVLPVASVDYTSFGSTDAWTDVFFTDPPIVQVATSTRDLYLIPVVTGTPTFDASTVLSIELLIEMC